MLVVAVASLVLGSIVLLQKSGSSFICRIAFFASLVFAGLWSFFLAMFLLADSVQMLHIVSAAYYAFSSMIFCSFTFFVLIYTGTKIKFFHNWLIVSFMILFVALSASGLLLDSVAVGEGGANNSATVNQTFYTIYSICVLIISLAPVMIIMRGYRRTSSPDGRNRLNYILAAYAIAAILGLFFNLVLPWLGNYNLIWIGPLGMLFFAGIIYAAMVRYRLFDMRTVVARVLTHAFIITILSLLYVVILSVIAVNESDLGHASPEYYVANVVLMAAIVLLWQPFAKYTRILVDRWFLRDNYNPAELIAKINRLAVGRHNPYELILRSAQEIAEILCLKYAQIIIQPLSDDSRLEAGTAQRIVASSDEMRILALMQDLNREVVMIDDIENHKDVAKLFRKYKIAAFVSIGIESDGTSASRGYMLLGAKQRRSVYVQKDYETLEAVANILALAIESARYYQRIQMFNRTLEARIDEATASLRSSNRKLKRLYKAEDDFITMASHQLRTPLTSIRGYISMLIEGDFGGYLTSSAVCWRMFTPAAKRWFS